jgi:BirA family transcriptional regulator, biotin operon repressor / biotin---[acetyl-CoA-carboxylase] ligase
MAVSPADRIERSALLRLLADGEVRSGASLARELEARRGAVAKEIQQLRAQGVEVAAVARRGYRLPSPVELLDAQRIRARLGEECQRKLHRLEVLFEVDSTNTRLLASPAPPWDRADVCLSELQHAGRGRRGRLWVSPFGASIAMSIGWAFPDATRASPALSLAVGVGISRALERVGARGIRLKWPNDVWFNDRKIGGVLVELKTESGRAAHVVIGVGLNLSLSAASRREFEAGGVRVAALADACPAPVPRNAVAAAILEELLSMLGEFEREGFAPFREEWGSLDALGGRPARVSAGDSTIEGVPGGVDVDGALLLESGGRWQRFVSGEVSLRLKGDA